MVWLLCWKHRFVLYHLSPVTAQRTGAQPAGRTRESEIVQKEKKQNKEEEEQMRPTAVVALSAGAGILCCCDAFVVSPQQHHHVLASQHQQQLVRLPAATASTSTDASPPRPLLTQGPRAGLGVRRTRRASLSMSSAFDAAGDAAAARAVPVGPGAGVIDLKFENLKTGGFKVFLLLFLLGVSATYVQQ